MDDEVVNIDGRYMTEEQAIAADEPVCTREEFEVVRDQVAEIHQFIKGVAEALNNPMVRAMMPPGMLGR